MQYSFYRELCNLYGVVAGLTLWAMQISIVNVNTGLFHSMVIEHHLFICQTLSHVLVKGKNKCNSFLKKFDSACRETNVS